MNHFEVFLGKLRVCVAFPKGFLTLNETQIIHAQT